MLGSSLRPAPSTLDGRSGRLYRGRPETSRDDDLDLVGQDADPEDRRPPRAEGAARVAVELIRDGDLRADRGGADPAMLDAVAAEVEAAEDEPEVMQRLEGAGVAEDDQVELAVVPPGGRARRGGPRAYRGRLKTNAVVPTIVSSAPGSSTRIERAGNRYERLERITGST
jgi:hypothetical protein